MPRKRTHEEFVKELQVKLPNIVPLEEYKNNNTKIRCRCLIHDEVCESTPKRLLAGHQCCKKCISEDKRRRLVRTHEEFLQLLKDKNIDVVPLEEYVDNTTKILFKCSCGDIWETTPERVLLGNHCKKCGYKSLLGNKNHFYNPNLSSDDRLNAKYRFRQPEYKKFIRACFERDDYTCQLTGLKSKGDIVVHHLNGYNWDIKNRFNVNNGITLNQVIHNEFHKLYGKGNNTKEQFIEFVDMLYKNNRVDKKRYDYIMSKITIK